MARHAFSWDTSEFHLNRTQLSQLMHFMSRFDRENRGRRTKAPAEGSNEERAAQNQRIEHLLPEMRFYEDHHTGALIGETLSTSCVPRDLDDYPTVTTGQKIFLAFVSVNNTKRRPPSAKRQKGARAAFAVLPFNFTCNGHSELLMVRPYIEPGQDDDAKEYNSAVALLK